MAGLTDKHGAARQVPPAEDVAAWRSLLVWIGASAGELTRDDASGATGLTTTTGREIARPGDWIIRTIGGAVHLGRATTGEEAPALPSRATPSAPPSAPHKQRRTA